MRRTYNSSSIYDANTNTDCHLMEIEKILEDMESNNRIIIGGDFNTITDKKKIGSERLQR